MPGVATLLSAPLSTTGPGAERDGERHVPSPASHTARVADVLARWREAVRACRAADPLGEDAARLEEEVERLREAYQALTRHDATDASPQ